MSNGRLLSTAEVAEHLGLSEGHLVNLRLRGGGPRFVKLGWKVAYDPSDLTAWIEANKRTSTSDTGSQAVA